MPAADTSKNSKTQKHRQARKIDGHKFLLFRRNIVTLDRPLNIHRRRFEQACANGTRAGEFNSRKCEREKRARNNRYRANNDGGGGGGVNAIYGFDV